MTEGTEIKYEECYVAFIDILGFKGLVAKSQKDPAMLEALVRVLNYAGNIPRAFYSKAKKDAGVNEIGEDEYLVQVRAFSDSIVLFIPVASKGLSSILNSVRYVHDRMIECNYVIRGAVTIGDMYYEEAWSKTLPSHLKVPKDAIEKMFNTAPKVSCQESDKSTILYDRNKLRLPITLGPAMIEAYTLENEAAVYPRVLISESLNKHVNDCVEINNKTFPLVSPSPKMRHKRITDFICSDFDGAYYFDFFHKDIYRQDTERIIRQKLADEQIIIRWEKSKMTYKEFLGLVKTTIEENLKEVKPEKAKFKYQWLKNYFNRKCDAEMKINPEQISRENRSSVLRITSQEGERIG